MQIESFADINGCLNNDKNLFIEASDNLSKISESNISNLNSLEKKIELNMDQKILYILLLCNK
jgi:hypothetical protein